MFFTVSSGDDFESARLWNVLLTWLPPVSFGTRWGRALWKALLRARGGMAGGGAAMVGSQSYRRKDSILKLYGNEVYRYYVA